MSTTTPAPAPAATPAKAAAKVPSREKFATLASKRVSLALAAIKRVGTLGNKREYAYTEADVIKIEAALNSMVARVIDRMRNPEGTKAVQEFTIN